MGTIAGCIADVHRTSQVLWRMMSGRVKVRHSRRVEQLGIDYGTQSSIPEFKSGQENEMVLKTAEDFLGTKEPS